MVGVVFFCCTFVAKIKCHQINRVIDTKIQGLKSEFMNICSDLESRITTVEQQLTELGETRPSVVENPFKNTEKCVIARGLL